MKTGRLLLVAALSSLLSACSAPPETSDEIRGTRFGQSSPAAPTSSPPAPSPDPAAPPQHFEGRSKSVTAAFPLEAGLTLFEFNHTGRANFIVHIKTSDGAEDVGFVNEIGPWEGSWALGVEKGEYVLDVEASGSWTVDIEQPRPLEAPAIPQSLTGPRQAASPFFAVPNQAFVRFHLKHQGKANFIVHLLTSKGIDVEGLVNEIGPFEGDEAVAIPPGIYLLTVAADGTWSIDIST